MKKYIAPEIEMINFSSEDIVTTSTVTPAPAQITGNDSYTFESGIYGEF